MVDVNFTVLENQSESWKSPEKVPVSDFFFFLERVQTLSFTYTGTGLT